MSTSGVLVRAAAARVLPDLMQKSPHGDPTIDFSLLGRHLKAFDRNEHVILFRTLNKDIINAGHLTSPHKFCFKATWDRTEHICTKTGHRVLHYELNPKCTII